MQQDLNLIHIPLSKFVLGKTKRLFSSNSYVFQTDISKSYEELNSVSSDVSENSMQYEYFMKSQNRGFSVNLHLDDWFKDKVKYNLRRNLSGLSYDTELKELSSIIGICSSYDNCYILTNDYYATTIKPEYNLRTDVKALIHPNGICYNAQYVNPEEGVVILDEPTLSSYISNDYGLDYYSRLVESTNDLSLPVYIANDFKNNIFDCVKFHNQESIDSFASEYDIPNEDLRYLIYDTKNNVFSGEEYDSIMVKALYEYLKNHPEKYGEEKITSIFNDLYANLPLSSFIRFLNPIGKINTVNINDETYKFKDVANSLYSISLSNSMLSSNIDSFNVLTLKNYRNPEYNADYIITNDNIEVRQDSQHSLFATIVDEMYHTIEDSISNLSSYIESHNLNITSGAYISANELSGTLINIYADLHPAWTTTQITNWTNSSVLREIIYKDAFRKYMYDTYEIDISKNSYVLSKEILSSYVYDLRSSAMKISEKWFPDSELTYYINKYNSFFDKCISKLPNSTGNYLTNREIKLYKQNVLDSIEGDGVNNNPLTRPAGLTRSLLNKIIDRVEKEDYELVKNFPEYAEQFPTRFSAKKDSYLSTINDLYTYSNDFLVSGYLNGLRTYASVGNTNNSMWMSYNYQTESDQYFVDNFDQIIKLDFREYTIKRTTPKYAEDSYFLLNSNYSNDNYMFFEGFDWNYNDFSNSTNVTSYKMMSSYVGEHYNILMIPSSKFNRELITETDIIVNDELFLIPNITEDFDDSYKNIAKYSYKGFGGLLDLFGLNSDENIYNSPFEQNAEILQIPLMTLVNRFNIPVTYDDGYNSLHHAYIMISHLCYDVTEDNDQRLYLAQMVRQDDTNEQVKATIEDLLDVYPNAIRDFKFSTYVSLIQSVKNANVDGYLINKKSLLNGSHIIPAGITLCTIPAGQTLGIMIKAWFSKTIKCTGKLKLKVANNSLTNNPNYRKMLNNISKYQFIEKVEGFHKYKNSELTKSNVYSIKLRNSGLNPENDVTETYISYDQIQEILGEYGFSYDNDYDVYTLNSREYSLEEAIDKVGYEKRFINGEIVYIDKNVVLYNNERQDLRNLIEDSIRKSISRYMPANTTLWKILYEGS